MTDAATQDRPLHLAMDLGHCIARASTTGTPTPELCRVVVDVAIAACRAGGMDQEAALELFTQRARRRIESVPLAPAPAVPT